MIGPWARASAALAGMSRVSAARLSQRVSRPSCVVVRLFESSGWSSSSASVSGSRSSELPTIAPARPDLFRAPSRALHGTSPLVRRERRRVAVVGGGFGGLYTALALDSLLWEEGKRPRITLVTSDERFEFRPLLFDALLGVVSEDSAAPRLSGLLRGTGVRLRRGGVVEVLSDICPGPGDPSWKVAKERRQGALGVPCVDSGGELALDDGSLLRYDWLVLATGPPKRPAAAAEGAAKGAGAGAASAGSFTRPAPSVPGSATLALRFRSHADLAPAKAALARAAAAAARRQPGDPSTPPRVVIVGGGPSGVELAAAAGQLSGGAAVALVCDGRPLAGMPEGLRLAAERALEAAGVEVLSGLHVRSIRRDAAAEGENGDGNGAADRRLVVAAEPAGTPAGTPGVPPPPPLELDALAVFWCAGEVSDPTLPRPTRRPGAATAAGAGTPGAPAHDGASGAVGVEAPGAGRVPGAREGDDAVAASDSEDLLSSDGTAYDLYGPPPPGAWDDGAACGGGAVGASAEGRRAPLFGDEDGGARAFASAPAPPPPCPHLSHPFETDALGRVAVTSSLRSPSCSRTFAVGDAAGEVPGGADRWAAAAGSPRPGGTPSAQRAMQEARVVAENIWKAVHEEAQEEEEEEEGRAREGRRQSWGADPAQGTGRSDPDAVFPSSATPFVYSHVGDMLSFGSGSGAVTPAVPVPRFLAEAAARGSPLWRALELAGVSVSGGAAGDAARKSYERTEYGVDEEFDAKDSAATPETETPVLDVSSMSDADLDALWTRGGAGVGADGASSSASSSASSGAPASSTSDRVAQITVAGPLGAAARRAAYAIRQPTPALRVRVAVDVARSAGEAAAKNVGAFIGAVARVAGGRYRRA